jgi:hypothetical protein
MKKLKYIGFSILLILTGISFSGCAGDATQIGPNKFTNTSYDREMAYQKANITCWRMGLAMQPLHAWPVGMDYAINFTCVYPKTITKIVRVPVYGERKNRISCEQ